MWTLVDDSPTARTTWPAVAPRRRPRHRRLSWWRRVDWAAVVLASALLVLDVVLLVFIVWGLLVLGGRWVW